MGKVPGLGLSEDKIIAGDRVAPPVSNTVPNTVSIQYNNLSGFLPFYSNFCHFLSGFLPVCLGFCHPHAFGVRVILPDPLRVAGARVVVTTLDNPLPMYDTFPLSG